MRERTGLLRIGLLVMCFINTIRLADGSSFFGRKGSEKADVVKQYEEQPPNVFSPEGRLYAVERAVKSTTSTEDRSANLCVALHCNEGLIVVSTCPKSPHLDVEVNPGEEGESIPLSITTGSYNFLQAPFAAVAPMTFVATGGNAVDSVVLRNRIHQIATALIRDWGMDNPAVTTAAIARQLADLVQRPTQDLSVGRILTVSALIFSPDSLWRVDPTGQFYKCGLAASIGKGSFKAETILASKLKDLTILDISRADAISIICQCIEASIGTGRSSKKRKVRLRGVLLTKEKNSKRVTLLKEDELVCEL